jgi:hypothetical protein
VGHTFGRVAWTMDDFYRNLKLCNLGIDIRNNLNLDLVTNAKLEVFRKRRQNGLFNSLLMRLVGAMQGVQS